MPRIHDARQDRGWITALRVAFSLVACGFGVVALHQAGNTVGDPSSAFHRYRAPAAMPHVFAEGTVQHRVGSDRSVPPLCLVEHERWMSCGKSRCWSRIESFTRSDARIVLSHATGTLPESMDLAHEFHFEPWRPSQSDVVTSAVEEMRWRDFAKANHLGFGDENFHGSYDRVVTTCAQAGEPLYVEACVSPTKPGVLESWPGRGFTARS